MIVTLHEQRARGRQRLWWSVAKLVLALVVLGGTFLFAHRMGRDAGGREVNGLRQEVAVLDATIADLQAKQAMPVRQSESSGTVSRQVEADAQEGVALLDSLLARNAELETALAGRPADAPVPAEMQDLLDLLQAKLAGGVSLARLRAVVEGVRSERACAESVDSRRLVVQTPARRDEANGSVTFASGITVTADGVTPAGAAGAAGLRYDPEQPVTVRFVVRDDAPGEVSGTLPLEHALVLGDQEHRFMAQPDAPGLLRVTERICAYP